MRHVKPLPTILLLGLSSVALAGPVVTLTLESSKDGRTVGAGSGIDWTIRVATSGGDNAGLALVCVDLVQDDANPAFLDIPPGDPASIDATMGDFSLPLGISNPGEGGATTGYVGVQRGTPGRRNLVQIGGGQNTFGVVGPPGLGQDLTIRAGIGQGVSPQIVLSGSFAAPRTPGTYTFKLQNSLANVLTAVNPPPQYSPVAAATVDLTGATFSFTVSPGLRGDLNCDGQVTFDDIEPFVAALAGQQTYESQYPTCRWLNGDIEGDGWVTFDDINPFVACLVSGGCP
jgi:hypothetical protein